MNIFFLYSFDTQFANCLIYVQGAEVASSTGPLPLIDTYVLVQHVLLIYLCRYVYLHDSSILA